LRYLSGEEPDHNGDGLRVGAAAMGVTRQEFFRWCRALSEAWQATLLSFSLAPGVRFVYLFPKIAG
jgi:hypothetical protein